MDARVTVKQNGDFRRIYRRGRSAVAGGVVVYCLKNRQGMSRLGKRKAPLSAGGVSVLPR